VNSGSSFTSVLTAGCVARYRLLRTLVQLHNEIVMAISLINLIARYHGERRDPYAMRMNLG